MPKQTLRAFTPKERERAHHLLAARVAYMMGRKFEENDWAQVYCGAKGIPRKGWSNLNIDVMHNGLGVEHKMMAYRSNRSIKDACGTTLMHPAATRAIRVPVKASAQLAMKEVLEQYGNLIAQRTAKVRETRLSATPDMRTGWLLWQERLAEFLYFEVPMVAPDPSLFRAEWVTRASGSTRKGSRNLWIYEKKSGKKRYSVTSEAGAKIQPYFDVPPPDDPNLYVFVVQGEVIKSGLVRLWLTVSTAEELQRLIGKLDTKALSQVILAAKPAATEAGQTDPEDAVREVTITGEAYEKLRASFGGISDEHSMLLLIKQLREAKS